MHSQVDHRYVKKCRSARWSVDWNAGRYRDGIPISHDIGPGWRCYTQTETNTEPCKLSEFFHGPFPLTRNFPVRLRAGDNSILLCPQRQGPLTPTTSH